MVRFEIIIPMRSNSRPFASFARFASRIVDARPRATILSFASRSSLARLARLASLSILAAACHTTPVTTPSLATPLDNSRQLVVVTTPDWNATSGSLWRFDRTGDEWHLLDGPTPIVVGRTGLAWGRGFERASANPNDPIKHEGDGKSPAGIFPLDTAFGLGPVSALPNLELPYVQLQPTTDCVDDTASVHYNTVVDRGAVPAVDWSSAEHMRRIDQYRIGVIVGYNADPPVRGRGSCIFLHIWAGPASTTAGCTALDAGKLRETMLWLDRAKRPMLVQLTSADYARLREPWRLPELQP